MDIRCEIVAEISGRSGAGLGEYCGSSGLAMCSALSCAEKRRPFRPGSGWVVGHLCRRDLLILKIDPFL